MRVRLGWFGVVASVVAVSLCAIFIGCDSTKSAMDQFGKIVQELFEDKYVTMVKNGTLKNCPNYTVGTLVENYMKDPKWESGKADDGNTYVNIIGNITFYNKPARGALQLLIKGNSFSFYAFEINDEPQSDFLAMVLLGNMCERAEKRGAKLSDAQQGNTGSAKNAASSVKKGSFADKRDGKVYKTVKIGRQNWFAENLNFAAKGSVCYENNDANCAKYGRLYDWKTALTACPAGTHLPTDEEWETLVDYAGGEDEAGEKLKSTSGWKQHEGESGNGTDNYGFAALPGGAFADDHFEAAGTIGLWWSATEDDDDDDTAWRRGITNGKYMDGESVDKNSNDKASLFSVRCVQDK